MGLASMPVFAGSLLAPMLSMCQDLDAAAGGGRLALLLLLPLLLGGDAGGLGRAAVADAAPHEHISSSTWSCEAHLYVYVYLEQV